MASEDDLRQMRYDSYPSADRRALENFDIAALCDETVSKYRRIFAAQKPENPWVTDSKEDLLYHIGALAKGRDGNLRAAIGAGT